MAMFEIHCGDALDVMRGMADNSVDAIVTDPPYFKTKGREVAWDWQWDKPAAFLSWIGELCTEWQRVLKPNGSLYCFASPKMARQVGNKIAERFNVLTDIRWRKPPFSTKAEMFDKDSLRAFFPASETIWFAEHFGADNIAKGEAGYVVRCDELRGFVFEPLRAYLLNEITKAGLTKRWLKEQWMRETKTKSEMPRHWFEVTQWELPTIANYEWLRAHCNAKGGEYLRREYEDLRREYEDLRREYEDLRRPFSVTADVPYTDVWDFPTVQAFKGKHPCQKPLPLISHIIRSSTREGATVLDCFSGSGVTGEAALRLGRSVILIEKDAHWVEESRKRCEQAANVAPVVSFAEAKKRHDAKAINSQPRTLPLFDGLALASGE